MASVSFEHALLVGVLGIFSILYSKKKEWLKMRKGFDTNYVQSFRGTITVSFKRIPSLHQNKATFVP